MKNINFKKYYYRLKQRYFNLNNVVIIVALIIGASWAWGSVSMMQRNYALQSEIDAKSRQAKLAELETAQLKYEQNYYQSREYQELAAREYFGLSNPGEKVLILPPNSQSARDAGERFSSTSSAPVEPVSNFQQWINFLFGGNRAKLQE